MHFNNANDCRLTPEAQQAQQARISDVGDGLLEGVGAFGSSIFKGIKGLVEKPVQGAKRGGVEGAVKGMAQGLVGVVANPLSGALSAMSATAQGMDASLSKNKSGDNLVMQRRKLPRVVAGDGRLLPAVRDGSDRQAVLEALGQALLRNSLLAAAAAGAARKHGVPTEAYEEHFVLPDDNVLLFTNRGLILINSPGFTLLDGAAEIGALDACDVAPGVILWTVRWDDVLAFELRFTSSDTSKERYPDRLVVHRKGTFGRGNEDLSTLAHAIRCFPNTPQAVQAKLVAQKILQKYYLDPQRRDRQWSERHAARRAVPANVDPKTLPLTMPCLDFVMTWHTNPNRTPVVSFWRPIPPAGYVAVGDVAALGLEPPVQPVLCFRDDAALGQGRSTNPSGTATEQQSQAQGQGGQGPATAHPAEYSLIWRFNGSRPVSMWWPVAPAGYVSMGALVLGQPQAPILDDCVCIREDLTAPARVFDSPIWSFDSASVGGGAAQRRPVARAGQAVLQQIQGSTGMPDTWKVSIWPVDSRLGNFVVIRALSRPPQSSAHCVKCVEEKLGGG